jgi:quinohemoprotein ethanol dehydrogenase
VWDSMAYDPALNLIYIGVGNGTPWNRAKVRGDALYLSSIVAVNADSGEYVWHYQTTPGDEWDYDACSPMILADLRVGGSRRKVIMQAPKNGFFYVLDRATGELLSADPYTITNWAKSIDLKTGRPVVESAARYSETGKPFVAMPGPGGGHSWQPMSFSPVTRLVYVPVTELSFPFVPEKSVTLHELAWNTGVDFNAGSCHGDSATGSGVLPDLRYSGLIKSPEAFDMTVRQGTRVDQGMVAFKDEVSPQDLEQIRAYVIHRANEDKLAAARR